MPTNTWPLPLRLMLALILISASSCANQITLDYTSTLDTTAAQIKQLAQELEQPRILLDNDAAQFHKGQLSFAHLQQQLLNTRLTYKCIELINEYYYPETNATMLAPLNYQKPNAQVNPLNVVTPERLQALNER